MSFTSNKAHVYNTARTCEAIQATGKAKITLISSDDSLLNDEQKDAYFKKNSVSTRFEVVSLNSISRFFARKRFRLFNYLEVILANITLARFLLKHKKDIDVIYFRDPLTALPILINAWFIHKPFFFEAHAVLVKRSTQAMADYLSKKATGIISISHGLEDYYATLNGHNLMSFCAAAEPERFAAIKDDKTTLRKKLGLPADKILLGYTGNLSHTGNNDSYGVEDIIEAIPLLDDKTVFVGVGKKGNETEWLTERAKELSASDRVMLLPWVSRDIVAQYIKSFDVLLIPAAGARIGNSPSKLFEYLISGIPIVAAHTPAIAEVLKNRENALLVDYKNPNSWKQDIESLLSDKALGSRLVAQAMKDGSKFTWPDRGRDIIGFIESTIHAQKAP